jgi:hypothetical protein
MRAAGGQTKGTSEGYLWCSIVTTSTVPTSEREGRLRVCTVQVSEQIGLGVIAGSRVDIKGNRLALMTLSAFTCGPV